MNLSAIRRRITPPLLAAVFYYGCLIYPLLRLIDWLIPAWRPGTPVLLALLVLPLLLRIVFSVYPNSITRWLGTLSLTWMGLCFQLFAVVVVLEAVRLIAHAIDAPLSDPTIGLVGLVTIGIIGTWGFVNALVLNVRRVPIRCANAVDGMSLVQITDVHIGSRRPAFLRRIVQRINSLDCDAVLITGDLVDSDGVGHDDLSALAELRFPAYFTIGNHERYEDTGRIIEHLRAHGVRVLRNESVDAKPFQFIGLDDAEPRDTVARGLGRLSPLSNRYRVLLYHRPEGAEDAAEWGAHLMASGHTHRGQLFPFNYIVRRVHPRLHGTFHINGLTLYVSPGTGTWGPVLRTNSRCEITHFQLAAHRSDGRARG